MDWAEKAIDEMCAGEQWIYLNHVARSRMAVLLRRERARVEYAQDALEWINRNATEVDILEIINHVNTALMTIEEGE